MFEHPLMFLILVVALLYSVIAHEVAHGLVALLFGDDTAKTAGRLTLNPIPHLDPVGAIMLFLVGFGWAKPVPVNYYRLKARRVGLVSVALAGCMTNFLIAITALFFLQSQFVRPESILTVFLSIVVRINIILGVFNLIPIPPLDGSKILMGFLSKENQRSFSKLEPYGILLLIILLVTGALNPVILFMQKWIYGLFSALF